MKKLITALLAFSLSFFLIIPAHAVSVGEIFGMFSDVYYNNTNCGLRIYNTSSPSINACDASGVLITQPISYSALSSLFDTVAREGANFLDNLVAYGQFHLISYGGYSWIQFVQDNTGTIMYCHNAQGKIFYAPAPATGDSYLVANIVGSGYYLSNRPIGMAASSSYAGDISVSQSAMDSALSVLNSSSSNYVYCLGFVGSETRYYIKPTNNTTTQHLCNSSGQLMYYLKSAPEEEPVTPPVFDDTEVITAINSVYGAIVNLGNRISTLINSVDTISQNIAVHISNFVAAITSLRDDIGGLQRSMEYTFAEFTQLYPSDATMTLSPGDTLDWNSAYKQDAVSHFETIPTTSPVIYATGINGFSGNAEWVDGAFTLTPSTGTYFSQTIDVGGVSIDMPSHVVSTAVPNPAHVVPDGYTQYEYIQSTGTQWIDTGRAFSMGDVYNIHLSDYPHVKVYANIWGSYKSASGLVNCRKNLRTYDTKFRFTDGTAILFKFEDSANGDNSIVINYGTDGNLSVVANGTNVGNGSYSASSMPMYLFNVNGIDSGVPASIRLYSYSVTNSGTLSYNLVPCANPSGEVGMYDTVSGTFYGNSGTGSFIAGAEVPALIGEDIIDYYNISAIYRGGMTGDYYHWYAIDGDGLEYAFSEDACRQLDVSFSAYSFNSIDTFTPQEGSYVVTWDDTQTGDIVIEYKAMSRFFSWLYRFLNNQQLFMQNTIVPALENTGGSVSQSINTTINNITVNDTDIFYNVYNFGDGDNIVDAGKDGINKVGGLLKWLWGNTFKGAFENFDVDALDGLFATYSDVPVS